jgi:hypothetical protein
MNRRHTQHVPRPLLRSRQRQAARSVRLSFESLEDRLMLDVGRESKQIRSRLL